MNTRNGLRYAATGAVTETRYKTCPLRYPTGGLREDEVRYTTPNVTLPTRNTLRQAQGNAFTGQVSHVSDDATDLGSSGFGLMFYQSRWYTPNEYKYLAPIEDLKELAHLELIYADNDGQIYRLSGK